MLELATPADRETVNTLAQQVHSLHVSWRPDIYCAAPEPYPEERFTELVRDRCLYVARIGEMVVGYVTLRFRQVEGPGMVSRKILHIDDICVEESMRNQGIGTQMMLEVRVLARAFGCTDLMLGVYPQNDEAVAFYQKCGFMIQSIAMQRKV